MDQKKTGRFIAERRRELNLTQKDLADKLGITDRAVSKWENGRCMPDLSLLQPLSRILKVGVNDLLSGEIISGERLQKKERRKSDQYGRFEYSEELSVRFSRVLCAGGSSACYTAL